MCLLTLGIWIALFVAVLIIGNQDQDAGAIAALVALGLGVVAPIFINYWRPLIFGWHRKRKVLRDKLLAEGVLTNDDIDKGARFVDIWEVTPGTERKMKGTKQEAFLVVDPTTLRVLGDTECFTTNEFKIIPGCTGRCSRCWVIWACGGDTFRLRTTVKDKQRDFLLRCREGRTLRQAARTTEMLEELVELDADASKESPGEQDGTA